MLLGPAQTERIPVPVQLYVSYLRAWACLWGQYSL